MARGAGENQHWIPKFLIRNFADADGRLFYFNLDTDGVGKRPPKSLASAPDFNEFEIAGQQVSFEERLGEIENRAAPTFKHIAASRSAEFLTPEQRRHIAEFIATQSFRTQAFYAGMASGKSRKEFGAIFTNLWRSVFLVADEIVKRRWAVINIEGDEIFYLGDHPVVLQFIEKPETAASLGFDVDGTEAYVPLSPKCALWIPCISFSDQVLRAHGSATGIVHEFETDPIGYAETYKHNPGIIDVARRVLEPGGICQALLNGAGMVAGVDNIINFNSLQILWAHRMVFSNRRDFGFVVEVLRKTPSYRQPPRASMQIFGS